MAPIQDSIPWAIPWLAAVRAALCCLLLWTRGAAGGGRGPGVTPLEFLHPPLLGCLDTGRYGTFPPRSLPAPLRTLVQKKKVCF